MSTCSYLEQLEDKAKQYSTVTLFSSIVVVNILNQPQQYLNAL